MPYTSRSAENRRGKSLGGEMEVIMRNVILFIAMSLDGYIADRQGGVGWLNGQGGPEENIDTYSQFIKDVDTVIMGWNTYRQITTELSPGEWVYQELTSYVVTHRDMPSEDRIIFTKTDPCQLARGLKDGPGKKIWICGGADIVQQLLREDLIDEYHLSVIPTILGSGVRLFGTAPDEIPLRLTDTRTYNGITELIYTRRKSAP